MMFFNSLHQAQLTFKLYGYQFGPAKRYVKAVKTYFVDTGIIRSLNARVSTGQLLENFVLAELEKRRRLGIIRADQFCYVGMHLTPVTTRCSILGYGGRLPTNFDGA